MSRWMILGLVGLGPMGCAQEYDLAQLEQSDTFTQLPATEVDILLVVDNSCSMQPYQNELAKNFDGFLEFFETGNVDYHIGVLTTSVQEVIVGYGCTQQQINRIPEPGHLVMDTIITPDTDDAKTLFEQVVNVGTCGSGSEMGLESAALAVRGGVGSDFLRDEAFLSIIFVSDEEDSSPLPVNDYVNDFRTVKGPRELGSFNASALVLTDPDDCSPAQLNAGGTLGSRYIDVAEQGGGILGSICDDSFERVVTELSLASSRLSDRFYLTGDPDPYSIVVNIEGVDEACSDGQWTYQEVEYEGRDDHPAIVFEREAMPEPYEQIVVRYNQGGGGEFVCGEAE